MSTVRVRSYAKLNLTLNITGRAGGYHLLDSFVTSVDVFDEISLSARSDGRISVRMHGMGSEGLPAEGNVAVRAAQAFRDCFFTGGADIAIQKNIPMGAGMGGSSADAAGVINGMAALYGVGDAVQRKALADSLGSDTGYMLRGGFARMRGRGELVEPVQSAGNAPALSFLLLCPATPVSTAACYAEYDRAPDGPRADTEKFVRAFLGGDLSAMGKGFYNALFAPACRLVPAVAQAARDAAALSPLGYAMTGSGSAVFALFPSRGAAEDAARRYCGACRATVVSAATPERDGGVAKI